MTCRSCGAQLHPNARFCHACGAPVGDEAPTEVVPALQAEQDLRSEEAAREAEDARDTPPAPVDGQPSVAPEDVDMPLVDASDPVESPPARTATPASQDPTQTGVVGAALQARVPTPDREPSPGDQGAWREFVSAVRPLAAAPRFTGNLLAALVAFAVSLVGAGIAWLLLDAAARVLLPGLVDTDGNVLGVLALLTLVLHQVPLFNDGDMWSDAPLLLALVPLAGCVLGAVVARRAMPGSATGDRFIVRAAPFAGIYGLLLFVWSLFEAAGWHAGHLRSLLAGIVFALLGAWLAERRLAPARSTNEAGSAGHAPPRQGAPSPPARATRAVRTAARVLALTLVAASLAWLAGSLVEAAQRDDAPGEAVADAVLWVADGGFRALGFGVLAEGEPFGVADGHDTRIHETGGVLGTASFVILLLAAVVPVLVGGLFSGFAIGRRLRPASRTQHALWGAVTGPVWASAMLVAQFVVLARLRQDATVLTALDGGDVVLLSLLIGSLLGALGGLLAAEAGQERSEP